jgi:hypothetical protein
MLFRMLEMDQCALVLASSASDLETSLRKHIAARAVEPPKKTAVRPPVSTCTVSAPGKILSERDVATLRGLFSSLKELAAATPQGKALLRDMLDQETASDILDFWEDEYLTV